MLTCKCGRTFRKLDRRDFPVHCGCGATIVEPTDLSTAKPSFARSAAGSLANYSADTAKWVRYGRPKRSAKRVDELYSICSSNACGKFAAGRCSVCTCNIAPSTNSNALSNALVMSTKACPIGVFGPDVDAAPVQWLTNADRLDAVETLANQVPASVTAVAGVGRSGVAPAMLIAERFHLHAMTVSEAGSLMPVPHGYRFADAKADTGDLLVVDDTVATGRSMPRVRKSLEARGGRGDRDKCRPVSSRKVIYAALFVEPMNRNLVDLYARKLARPHYLEWNFFNSVHLPESAIDFDGVMCRDCTAAELADEGLYLHFLENVEPRFVPRRSSIPCVVTARLEKYRPQTLAWLRRWGITVDRLIMAATADEHNRPALLKSNAFAEVDQTIFVESCPAQSLEIAKRVPKRVICPTSGEVFN